MRRLGIHEFGGCYAFFGSYILIYQSVSLSSFRLKWRSFFVSLFTYFPFCHRFRAAVYRSIARYRDESDPERDPRDGAGLSILGNGDLFFSIVN